MNDQCVVKYFPVYGVLGDHNLGPPEVDIHSLRNILPGQHITELLAKGSEWWGGLSLMKQNNNHIIHSFLNSTILRKLGLPSAY